MPRQLTPRWGSGKLAPRVASGTEGVGSSGMAAGSDDRQAPRLGQARRRNRATAGRRPPRRPDESSLHNAALAYLGRFAASTEMVRRVLMRRIERAARAELIERSAGLALVETIVARLAAAGLVDDRSFAEQRARTLLRRGTAPAHLAAALGAKGISRAEAGRALAGLGEEIPDLGRAAALGLARRRRLGPYRRSDRAAHRDRDFAALARAGHAPEIARWVVDAEDLETLEAEAA